MIVDPTAPHITPPTVIASPDGWLTATVDTAWAGVTLAVNYTTAPPLDRAADVRTVRVVRQDPGAAAPVPVRSADTAWAIEGIGPAYDHEAPLGVAVVYTAVPVYADGTLGPESALAVTVPAPAPGDDTDLWIKSVDQPSLSLRAMLVTAPQPVAAGRLDTAAIAGSPYPAVAYDVHGAEAFDAVTIDVPPDQVDQVRDLLRSGVLLLQTRPGYQVTRDTFHVPGDITGPVATGKLGASGGFQFSWGVTPIERPDTAGQPLRLPGWSYDTLAERYDTYDAVTATYASYQALATNGALA
ncbi:hypothetical protein [Streptomyces tremellae]